MQTQFILKVSGTPFEMGYQHGSELKEKIQQNIQKHITELPIEGQARKEAFMPHIPTLTSYVEPRYLEEMQGLAEGSQTPFSDILLLNLFPEMFHCCGITATRNASKDKTLYHARVLDYSTGRDLQSTAVLMVAKPKEGFAFLNATYAGFIGSITGMNEKKISLGEIGGLGYGKWAGCPMPLLLRSILEKASNLQQAKEILSNTKRTCEYYYVIGDGNTQDSFGCYATPDQIQFIAPGETYSLLEKSPEEDLFLTKDPNPSEFTLFCPQPKDTLLLTGLAAPERYPILAERASKYHGSLDASALMEIIKQPVARKFNLHNAIFHPASLKVWIAHAGAKGSEETPACNEAYECFSLQELLSTI